MPIDDRKEAAAAAHHRGARGALALVALVAATGCTAKIQDNDPASGQPGTGGSGTVTGGSGGSAAGTAGGAGGAGSTGTVGGAGGVSATGGTGTGGGTVTGGAAGVGATGGTGGMDPLTPDRIDSDCANLNGALSAGLTRLRRLTRDQFNNTVAGLIQATGNPADRLNPDERVGPFNSNAISPVDNTLVQQHSEAATELAAAARARMSTLSPCNLDTGGTACATQFVTEFGKRAFRRPLDQAEIDRYLSLYTLGSQGATAADGFELVLEGMLQSPAFLYHTDIGTAPSSTPVLLGGYELASRLSYFLWNSMPDDALYALADNGTLTSAAVLTSEVERLLADDRSGSTVGLFHRQWLGISDLPTKIRDVEMFELWSPELGAAMLEETTRFSDYVVREADGLLGTLFTSNLAFPTGDLFQLYEVTQPQGYVAGTPVPLDATRRAGILTQAAFLANNAHNDQTSPVARGMFVRENILCQPLEDPPADVNTTPPPVTPATSTRERFAQHVLDTRCAGCHSMMDPIGLGFEHYDPIGSWREMDGLGDVDATGEFVDAAPDLDGPFNGGVELASKLAGSRQVRTCAGLQWFRFSMGRMESVADACSVKTIRDGFEASGGNVRSLLVQIAQSDAFRHVRSAE